MISCLFSNANTFFLGTNSLQISFRKFAKHWSPTSFSEWYAAQPNSFWNDGLEVCPESIYNLPQLSCENFKRIYSPCFRLLAQPDPLKRVQAKAFALPPARRGRNPDPAEEVDQTPCPSYSESQASLYNHSEDTLFNDIIHGENQADEELSPQADDVPPPVFVQHQAEQEVKG